MNACRAEWFYSACFAFFRSFCQQVLRDDADCHEPVQCLTNQAVSICGVAPLHVGALVAWHQQLFASCSAVALRERPERASGIPLNFSRAARRALAPLDAKLEAWRVAERPRARAKHP